MGNIELQDLFWEREWRKCAPTWDDTTDPEILVDAFEYWCSNYVYIRFPGKGKIKFKLRAAQREAVLNWLSNRQTIALKARQIGFSTVVSIFCLWATFFYPHREIILISRAEREARKLLYHAKFALKYMPDWMLLKGPLEVTNNQEVISFTNDSSMVSMPSASDPARGSTAFIIVVDEIGKLPNDEDAWASIEPVADVGGSIIMLGTANGEGNLLHDFFTNGKGTWVDYDGTLRHEGTGTNNFVNMFFGWWNADRDMDWYRMQERAYASKLHLLAQEYPSNPDEAFLKSGRPFFDLDVIRNLGFDEPIRGDVETVKDSQRFVEWAQGPLRLWAPPVEGHKYSVGVDVAEGLEHGDYSSVHVIDSKTQDVVAHWHGHIDADLLATNVIMPLCYWYNQALAIVENNNHGLATLTVLKREGYFPIYRQRRLSSKSQTQTDQLGWRTTVATKPLACDELNELIRDGDLGMPCSETAAELRTFVRDEKGRLQGSPHDDRVMSLAIAAQGLKYVHNREYKPTPKVAFGTVEWHRRQLNASTNVPDDAPIGAFSVAS